MGHAACKTPLSRHCPPDATACALIERAGSRVLLRRSFIVSLSLSRAAQYLKGAQLAQAARRVASLRKRYWGQYLWARGYWVASSGNVTDEVWAEYIKNQTRPELDDDRM
jgi:hypothetical protein